MINGLCKINRFIILSSKIITKYEYSSSIFTLFMIKQQKFIVADYAIFYLLINIIIPVGIYQMCDFDL